MIFALDQEPARVSANRQLIALGILAGAFISFGGIFYNVVMIGTQPGFGAALVQHAG